MTGVFWRLQLRLLAQIRSYRHPGSSGAQPVALWHRITGRATPEGMVLLVLVVVIVWWTVAIWTHTPVAARAEFP